MSNVTFAKFKFTVLGTSEWPATAMEYMIASLGSVSN